MPVNLSSDLVPIIYKKDIDSIAAGFLMAAANYSGDKSSAQRFRVLAAEAANKHEELSGEE